MMRLVLLALVVSIAAAPLGRASDGSNSSSAAVLAEASRSLELLSDYGPTRDQINRAERRFDRAASLQPEDGRWVMGTAYVAFHRQDFERCYELAKRAKGMSPDDAEIQYRYGNACFAYLPHAGFFSKGSIASRGRDAYREAINLDPGHVEAHFALGRFYVEAPGLFGGSHRNARDRASVLETRLGAPWLAHRLRAFLAAEGGDWESFESSMSSAHTAAPSAEDRARVLTEWARYMLDRAEDAQAALEVADRVGPEHAFLSGVAQQLRARALETLGRPQEAVAAAARAVETSGDDPDAWLLLGRLRDAAGDREGARTAYQRVLSRFPNDARRAEAEDRLKDVS